MLATLTLGLLFCGVAHVTERQATVQTLLKSLQPDQVRARYVGSTEKQVLDWKGPPSRKEGNVWIYGGLRQGFNDYLYYTDITFRNGRVVDVQCRAVPVGCIIAKPVRERK